MLLENGAPGDIAALLEKIYSDRGWDFRDYKKTSLSRRISKRMQAHNISTYGDYCSVLEADPAEYPRLFSNITIKVSEFFREREVYEAVSRAIKSSFPRREPIKAWSCGCAYGEEPYSMAIMLDRCLDPAALRRTKLFATDIDNEALDVARKGAYIEESLRNVSPEDRQKYFFESEGVFRVHPNIRNLVKFGALDIVRQSSISGVNLLFCRNLFIYFNKPLQKAVFQKLDYSLKPGGLIVLGKAEVLPAPFASRYEPVGDRTNIFRKRLSE